MKEDKKNVDDESLFLISGAKLSKLSPEFKAVCIIEELNSFVGLLRTEYKTEGSLLEEIQYDLVSACSMILNDKSSQIVNITQDDIEVLETVTEGISQELSDTLSQIPYGSKSVTYVHVCRTICTLAEIEVLVCLDKKETERIKVVAKYLNKLSSFFFVLAKFLEHKENET